MFGVIVFTWSLCMVETLSQWTLSESRAGDSHVPTTGSKVLLENEFIMHTEAR